jgi:hypothetical protein
VGGKKFKKNKKYLSLEASNCIAQIERLDSKLEGFRRVTRNEIGNGYLHSKIKDLEYKEFKNDCPICYEEIKDL